MERFFILDKFNTWYDWGLIVTEKEISSPEPKTNYVDIDGMSGSLDLTESLTGEVAYNDRTLKASFWTDNGKREDREILMRKIITSLHGKKIKIIEPDDPEHYYLGRVKIKSQTNILPYLEFSIEAQCEPWRYVINEAERLVEVDNNAVTTVIHNNGVKTLRPTVTVTGSVTISFNGVEISLNAGTYRVSTLKFKQGVNNVTISGSGSVKFTYREADL